MVLDDQSSILEYKGSKRKKHRHIWLILSLVAVAILFGLLRDIETMDQRTGGRYDVMSVFGISIKHIRFLEIVLVVTWCMLCFLLIRNIIRHRGST
jgi:uncharacterized membrane protein